MPRWKPTRKNPPNLQMKTKLLLLATLLASIVNAAPLTGTTAVHIKPDDASPSITFLKAGTQPTANPDSVATTPAGWLAVELPGPFEAYVQNKDIRKSLDVRTGAAIRLAPKVDAPVIATMEASDKADITGLRGKWTQIRLEKKITGYIRIGSVPGYLPPIATNPATQGAPSAPMSPAPVPATAYGVTTAGRPAPMVNLGDGSAGTLPRLFAGKLVSTRSAFKPRRPYDWALNDDAGQRYAYLDISKLLQTEQIESYLDHTVVVFGGAKPVPASKDIVIEVESLQLK
jgi:hypothetical protein